MNKRKQMPLYPALLISLVVSGMASEQLDPREQSFAALCNQVQRGKAEITESNVVQMIILGRELGHPFAAAAAVKSYTAVHPELSPRLQLMIAENSIYAGDYRGAVSRYKSYLSGALPGKDSSDAAASLYLLLIDFLDATDDALDFMKTHGEKFRQSESALKFDAWYLDRLQGKGELVDYVKRLTLIYSGQMPVEKESFFYGDYLNWMMNTNRYPANAHFGALPHLMKLLPLIRAENDALLKYRFYAANLSFKANSAGKVKDEIEREFDVVVMGARNYFDARPTFDVLKDIEDVFSCNFNQGEWQIAQTKKQDFFVYAFSKLSPENRAAAINWMPQNVHFLATPDQWASLCLSYPDAFARAEAMPYAKSNPELFKKQTPFLANIHSSHSAIVNALANGTDLESCARYVVDKESWHLDFNDTFSIINDHIWPIFRSFPRDATNALPGDYYSNFLLKFGGEILTKTPLPMFDLNAAKTFVLTAWNQSDKSKLPALLHGLDWIPYTEEEAETVFGPAYKEFLAWADKVRSSSAARKTAEQNIQTYELVLLEKKAAEQARDAARTKARETAAAAAAQGATEEQKAAAAKAAAEANAAGGAWAQADGKAVQAAGAAADAKEALAKLGAISEGDDNLIVLIENTFKAMLDPKRFDIEKAPNPLCKNLASAVVAARNKNLEEYTKIARQIYAQIRDFQVKKTPFGAAILRFITTNRLAVFDTLDFQLEVLDDQWTQFDPNISTSGVAVAYAAINQGRPGWPAGAPGNERSKVEKVNAVLEKALQSQLAGGKFWPTLFTWFRETRRGNGWQSGEAGVKLMTDMIEKKTLVNTDYRLDGAKTAACTYMGLIRNEFQRLGDKYPSGSYFDDLYVEECSKSGELDFTYWKYGADRGGKIMNLAAKLLQKYQTIPYTAKTFNSNNELWKWHSQCLRMNRKWRQEHNVDEAERDRLIAMLETSCGKTRYDEFALGDYYFIADADPGTPQGREQFFNKLATYVARVRSLPSRLPPPILSALDQFPTVNNAELNTLMSIFPGAVPGRWMPGYSHEALIPVMQKNLLAARRFGDLFAVVPFFWKMAKDMKNAPLFRKMADFASDLHEEKLDDLAAMDSISGLDIAGTVFQDDVRIALQNTRLKSLYKIGGGIILVDPTDPRYPIFVAQTAYVSGNYQNAWELYLKNPNMVREMFKELDPYFCLWLIEENTKLKNFQQASDLARSMMQWMDSLPEGFDRESKGMLFVDYADIAFANQEYPRARALYERVIASKEFSGTKAKNTAELRIADVDRLTKNYDRALAHLEKLARRTDRYLQTESFYQMALIKYEQEEYTEAGKLLDQVFSWEPNHVDGRLLQAELNLKLKKLNRATDIQIGLSSNKRILVPGKPLKVYLDDRNLAVAGKAANIEVRAWTDFGDEEFFNLFQLSDSKTKFEGELSTALDVINKGDHVLQVLGNDKVYYDFSEAFKKANNIGETEPMRMEVASDAALKVSSGKILTDSEEQQQYLEELEENDDDAFAFLGKDRSTDVVRPGNPIYVRVKDPDRSVSVQKDTVNVKVTSFSGDSIPSVVLTETAPCSGVFAGIIPTTSAGATAYASDADEGKLPAYAISSRDMGGWVGLLDNVRPKTFSVDLNDNVVLDKMNILADVKGRRLKNFIVQTSINGRDYTSMGSWPSPYTPWNGSPEFEFVNYMENTAPTSIESIRRYIDSVSVGKNISRIRVPLEKMFADTNSAVISLNERNIGLNWTSPYYVAHFRAAFCIPGGKTRTFKLDFKNPQHAANYFFAIDGEEDPKSSRREQNMFIKRSLAKGVHFIDIYTYGHRQSNGSFELLIDSDEPPYMIPIPVKTLDPKTNPEIAEAVRTDAAVITATNENTTFGIQFASNTHARVIRLVLVDFETDAPAIKRVSLSGAGEKPILPVKEDVIAARQNQILEIITGDTIAISYEDPKVVTEDKKVQEKLMTANFHDARFFSPLYRFKPGEKIDVFISDHDCDISDQRDVIAFAAKTQAGNRVQMKALETSTWVGQSAEHSGVFQGSIFTVTGTPTRADEIQVGPQENLTVSYEDKENTDPGIPWIRQYTIQQISYEPPELRVYSVSSLPIGKEKLESLPKDELMRRKKGKFSKEEYISPTRELAAARPVKPDYSKPVNIISDGPLLVELTCPAMALSGTNEATIYAQTLSGRKKADRCESNEFDINVPGTIRIKTRPGDIQNIDPPPGYLSVHVRGDPYASSALLSGSFSFNVKKQFGKVSGETLISRANAPEAVLLGENESPPLTVQGNDEIFVGFPYGGANGATNWVTQRVVMTSDVFFDIMDRYYREVVDSIYVGETLYFRVNYKSLDASDEKDSIFITLSTSSGTTTNITLVETFEHTGSFKGLIKPVYVDDKAALSEEGAVPVVYGDTITASYQPALLPGKVITQKVIVRKGADGDVIPFTKRFKDPEIAMQTQFLTAEAYFELAKKHRDLEQDSLARREIAQGKKLLQEAIKDFPDSEARIQADYLLADLALEFANDAVDDKMKKTNYLEAISRFSEIIMAYPDSIYSAKAQYKKALAFEKMGSIDQACEEYVKLSYTYPDSELIAQTIARLGHYFASKGKEFEDKAKETTDLAIQEKVREKARNMFKTGAEVFSRLAPRFPTHELAGKAMVLSGQCYMRSENYKKASEILDEAIKKTEGQDNELTAEAMYWRGDALMKLNNLKEAYRQFRNLSWNYPSSKWAKYARGRLTSTELSAFTFEE